MVWNSTFIFFFAAISLTLLPLSPSHLYWIGTLCLCTLLLAGRWLIKNQRLNPLIMAALFLTTLLGIRSARMDHLEKISIHQIPQGEYVEIRGQVVTQVKPWQETGYTFMLQSQTIRFAQKEIAVSLAIQMRIPSGTLPVGLCRGAELIIAAQLSPLGDHINFNMPDKKKLSLAQGVEWLGFCKSPQLIEVQKPGPLVWRILHQWREDLAKKIKSLPMPQDLKVWSTTLLEATLLGHPFSGDPDIYQAYLQSGSLHLLAISGTHIALLTGIILLLLKWMPPGMSRLFCAAIIIFYLFLAAAPISAQRSAIMACTWLWAKHRHRTCHPGHILGLAGGIDLLCNPFVVFSPAFLLTYLICYALVLGSSWIWQKTPPKNHPFTGVFRLAKTQWIAFLASAPLTFYLFNQATISSIPAGFLLIPLFCLLMPVAIFTLFISILLPGLNQIPLWAFSILIRLLKWILEFFTKSDMWIFYRKSPSVWMVLILGGLFFLSAFLQPNRFRLISRSAFALLFVFLFLPQLSRRPVSTEVHALDIGQGEVQVIVFPSGKSLMIDSGGSPFAEQRSSSQLVLTYLLNNRIHPDWIAISHFHPDHCGTLPTLLKVFKPKKVFISERPSQNPLFIEAMAKSPPKTSWQFIKTGYKMEIDDAVLLWLYPDQITRPQEQTSNGHSQVILLITPAYKMLFCGDIGVEEEAILIKNHRIILSCDILKVPHHGSKSSSSAAFLKTVSPQMALFHCGRLNSFHFPDPDVLARYKQETINTYCTWQGGILICNQNGTPCITTAAGDLITLQTGTYPNSGLCP